METKLELKHLAPYLPYKLQVILQKTIPDCKLGFNEIREGQIVKLIGLYDTSAIIHSIYFKTGLQFIKPILRPFSDLTKEIEVNGERFIPIVKLLILKYPKYYEIENGGKYSEIDFDHTSAWFKYRATLDVKILFWENDIMTYPEYWIIQKLFEWHFDVFGLIEQGLAVDINTLNKV